MDLEIYENNEDWFSCTIKKERRGKTQLGFKRLFYSAVNDSI